MSQVGQKTEVGTLDGTPEKRLFWSIISDYDLRTAICELIDNSVDQWMPTKDKASLSVSVKLDDAKQFISVMDNAGGVKKSELDLLITPGGSNNDPLKECIGIFGVGSKRAAVALGERIEYKTRFRTQETYQIDVTEDWLSSSDWEIPSYQIPNIHKNTTLIEITKLRKPINSEQITELTTHLQETYGKFLQHNFELEVNGVALDSFEFANWCFPPDYPPREISFNIELPDEQKIYVKITGGLISDRDAETENYGVYFYCNDRLIVKELKSRDVGYYVPGEAGVPHPDASLSRVIVELNGPAKYMPWNSSKTSINVDHIVFQQVRQSIIQLNSYYTSLSRRLKNDWDNSIYKYVDGDIDKKSVTNPTSKEPVNLPELPKVKKRKVEQLIAKNRKQINSQPWTVGLVESIAFLEIIKRQKFETGNRIALIVLDSNFEIALKEFIVHRSDIFPTNIYTEKKIRELFRTRKKVVNEVAKQISLPKSLTDKADHYYQIRNKLIHERATVGITDREVEDYRKVVVKILKLLFDLRF
ncbi:ATP-binding protein [Hyphococcus sp. DH-69]|uniref:ATP-binding protein n=1 Tax=Hyphococcus formosus TaxID=3143534 RepID=UPI00398A5EB6